MRAGAAGTLLPEDGTLVPVCVLCGAPSVPARGLVVDGHLLEVRTLCYALVSCRALLQRLDLDTRDRGVVTASVTELHTFFVGVDERTAYTPAFPRRNAAQS